MSKIDVGAYYFPDFHPDKRNREIHGEGWSEWNLVRTAVPRFPGHKQPKVPVWGCEDESDPDVMKRKIDEAADHGIDFFFFDYYHYSDGTFLERCLEEGFLKAENVGRMKFALMWANHDWRNLPRLKHGAPELLYSADLTEGEFLAICDYVIEKYFKHPCYYKIDGKPLFSFFELNHFLKTFGSEEHFRKMFEQFRKKTVAAGFPGLHLNTMVWGEGISGNNWGIARLPGEENCPDLPARLGSLGLDSLTSYTLVHHAVTRGEKCADYMKLYERYFQYWDDAERSFSLPYFPNATVGWDSSARSVPSETWDGQGSGPYGGIVVNNTPENFEKILRRIKERMEKSGCRILTVNSWNEWTEGSALEPEEQYGYGYLNALKKVFKDEK